jgi:hypothetical protein
VRRQVQKERYGFSMKGANRTGSQTQIVSGQQEILHRQANINPSQLRTQRSTNLFGSLDIEPNGNQSRGLANDARRQCPQCTHASRGPNYYKAPRLDVATARRSDSRLKHLAQQLLRERLLGEGAYTAPRVDCL